MKIIIEKLKQTLRIYKYKNIVEEIPLLESDIKRLSSDDIDLRKISLKSEVGKVILRVYLKASSEVTDIFATSLTSVAKEVAKILTKNSTNSCVVGGAVRDALFGYSPKDYDFVTDIPYDDMKVIFKEAGFSIKEAGKEFLVLIVSKQGEMFEIANFRKDGVYLDGRRPSKVEIGDIYDDANRRDFTINSLYYRLSDKLLIDPTLLGLDDISKKTLRFVGKPKDRIREDYIRVFRFYRFLSKKGLKPDRKSMKAVRELYNEAHAQSTPERVRIELEKMA